MEKGIDVLIIGAGASGLAAAIAAARAGASVLVLEKNHVPGRKVLSTGSGKCNFSNLRVTPAAYHAAGPAFLKKTFGPETLEENLDFIAKALGNKGNGSREIIRNYFLKDFFKDHCKVYQKRPIYWLFDSGKADGFKALIYLHRYNADTIGNLRIDYLHRLQRVYESEISRMQETMDNSKDAREVSAATKRKEKLVKQLKETKTYDEKIAHLAPARIELDLDDGVVVNYEKVQTGVDGVKLAVLAGL